MKINSLQIVVITVAVATTGFIGYFWLAGRADRPVDLVLIPPPEVSPVGELKATAEQEAAFKRAFWRRPEAGDRIRHAVLSEWIGESGEVSRWQWFIEVEPSRGLKQWLRERNPFSLAKKDSAELPGSAAATPDWFPKSAREFEILQSADGRKSLFFSREENVLFATVSGFGFAPGAPEPAEPTVTIATTGRLPLTPPPNPWDTAAP